jgi:PilZ domain
MASGYTIDVPLHTREERRVAERFAAAMPVTVDGHPGTTQDLSRTGLSFLADRPFEVGTRVAVVIEYLLDGHRYPLRCEAEVVRATPVADGNYSIGARLSPQSTLQDVAVGGAPPAEGGDGHGPRLRRVS